jgi:hypothetical protein
MSFKEIPPETLKALANVAKALGGTSFHVTPVRICDHCKDEEQEAFPYHVQDAEGNEWVHLCNRCFDILDCSFPSRSLDEFGLP